MAEMERLENIILNVECNKIEVNEVEYDIDKRSILIQIKHTLIDTIKSMDCFSILNEVNKNSFYFGYVSIGQVIQTGSEVCYCQKGMYILIPATYQKYILITEDEKKRLSQVMFYILSSTSYINMFHDKFHVKVIQVLFYPLFSVAGIIIERLMEEGMNDLILIGCHALGGIIMKLCKLQDISCEIIPGMKDVDRCFVEDNGGTMIIPPEGMPAEYLLSEEKADHTKKMILLESLSGSEYEHADSNKYLDINQLIKKEYGGCMWMDRYIQSNAEELLSNHSIDVTDMIGQHVHAEAAEETYKFICEGKYQGKLLVYDW